MLSRSHYCETAHASASYELKTILFLPVHGFFFLCRLMYVANVLAVISCPVCIQKYAGRQRIAWTCQLWCVIPTDGDNDITAVKTLVHLTCTKRHIRLTKAAKRRTWCPTVGDCLQSFVIVAQVILSDTLFCALIHVAFSFSAFTHIGWAAGRASGL